MTKHVDLPMEDFPVDHPRADDVRKLLGGGEMMSIARTSEYEAGSCYWMSERAAHAIGGHMVLGWRIDWLPDFYVIAEHHAVVQKGGNIFDVSAPATPRSSVTSTFVPDNSFIPDMSWPVHHESKFLHLTMDLDVKKAIRAYRENNAAMKKKIAHLIQFQGTRFTPGVGLQVPPHARAYVDQGVERQLSKSYRHLHEARANILKKYQRLHGAE